MFRTLGGLNWRKKDATREEKARQDHRRRGKEERRETVALWKHSHSAGRVYFLQGIEPSGRRRDGRNAGCETTGDLNSLTQHGAALGEPISTGTRRVTGKWREPPPGGVLYDTVSARYVWSLVRCTVYLGGMEELPPLYHGRGTIAREQLPTMTVLGDSAVIMGGKSGA